MAHYNGSEYSRYFQRNDDSKSHKLKNAYWTTKQVVINKLRRKQDENVVSSDADLDAKLELLKSIQNTCRDLHTVLERYQKTIYYLSEAENEMGRFLQHFSIDDKTQAGKIMSAVGKALSSSAQRRIALLEPLNRVHQEVKTFRQRAIADTAITLKRMEQARTEYRGALLWMKNVSEELDPDTQKQLERFRRVQAQVRKVKVSFDRLKMDSMQKIDLLGASRCNMLSHVLAGYQNMLLSFLEKNTNVMVTVADTFKGYQYYEFSILKHLRQESRKLATGQDKDTGDFDGLDDDEHILDVAKSCIGQHSTDQRCSTVDAGPNEAEIDRRLEQIFKNDSIPKTDLNFDTLNSLNLPTKSSVVNKSDGTTAHLGGDNNTNVDVPYEHKDLLTELFAINDNPLENNNTAPREGEFEPNSDSIFSMEWEKMSGWQSAKPDDAIDAFGPLQKSESGQPSGAIMDKLPLSPSLLMDQKFSASGNRTANVTTHLSNMGSQGDRCSQSIKPSSISDSSKQRSLNLDAWMDLLADLGPMGNPDSISKISGQISDA